ncbi:hypothetical protein ACIBF6_00640 [Streptosporangium amethystogenes]|uniref:hypothetical protein n=1 Tax=Streptosporangium amethystogenes TaxID=2002 RepID=UPI00378C7A32
MHHPRGNPRPIRVRWHADRPPMPLGCRWCGHPPYAHEAASLPHRAHHHWGQPTPAQVHARMTTRRRLNLSGHPPTPHRPLVPPPPTTRPGRPPATFPRQSPGFPQHPPMPPSQQSPEHPPPLSPEQLPISPEQFPALSPGRHRRPEPPVATAAVPYRRGRPPGPRTPGKHTPYRQGATA